MRIEFVDVPVDLAAAVDQLWPDSTWSEVIEHALDLLVDDALHTDRDNGTAIEADLPQLPDADAVDALARSFAAAPADADDLEQRIRQALGPVSA